MAPSLKALLHEIIDYAGLFPPAGLALDEALPNFARYRTEPEAWMLGRFVIPVGRLGDLAPFSGYFAETPPFRFSVLGTGADTANAFLDALAADLNAIRSFHRRHAGLVHVDALEVRLPGGLRSAEAGTHRAFFDAAGRRIADALPDLRVFFEVPLDDVVARQAPPLLNAMAAFNEAGPPGVGFKMRTGGLEPSAFPEAVVLAAAVTACRTAGVPFKATAGLHHPVRAYHASVQAPMYGFLNVFGGAVMATVHDLDADALRALLLDEDAAHFAFDDDVFAWRGLTASVNAIRRARTAFALSFGSCSFDEPRDDLRALGLS